MKSSSENTKAKPAVGNALRIGVYGVLLAGLVVGLACQQVEFTSPVAGTYSQKFTTPTKLNGVIVVGTVSFYSSSKDVEFATLATDQIAWEKTPLPAGTGIHFTREGKPEWCFLPRNFEIKGHIFRKGQGWMTEFYPDGELESGGLVNIEVIDGIPCEHAPASFWHIQPRSHFYKDGKLKSAVVAYTFRYRGQIIEQGRQIELRPDGSFFLGDDNPFVGTWKLNVEESTLLNPAPKSSTVTYIPMDRGARFVQETVDSQGKIQQLRALEWWDEKERESRFPGETAICSRIDSNTVVLVFKKDGKETRRVMEAISNGGRTLTRTSKDKDAQGNELEDIAVFEKQ
jgi:hypothetical protein